MSDYINKVKYITQKETSERLFDIHDYVENSCPKIDDAKKTAQYAKDYCEVSRNKGEEVEELFEKLDNAKIEVDYTIDKIEEIRDINSNIREWGEEWKTLAKELFVKLANSDFESAIEFISLTDEEIERLRTISS